MNNVQRIVKNMGVIGLANGIISVVSFFFIIYLARFLGEANFGIYNFALSVTNLIVIITDLGVNQLLVREIAREKELSGKYANNAFLLKIPLSIITIIMIALFINIFHLPTDVAFLLYLFGFYNIFLTFSLNYISLFQAWERMEYVALFQTLEKLIITCFSLFVLFLGHSILEIAYVYVFAGIFDLLLVMLLSFKKIIKPKFELDLKLQKNLLKKGLPFGLNVLFGNIFFNIDTILLAFIVSNVAVGIYTAAFNPLLSLSSILASMITGAVYPVMSRQFNDSKETLGKFLLITSKYLAIISFPIALGSLILAEKFILLFYNGNFMESVIPFQILSLFIPLRIINNATGTFLSSINRQGFRTFSVFISVIFNIVLNLMLIPSFNYIGASITTVMSEILLYNLLLLFVWKYYGPINVNKVHIKPLLGSSIMAVVVYFIKDFNLLLVIVIAAVTYFVTITLLKTFTEEDRIIFRNLRGL